MPSFRFKRDPKRKEFMRLITRIHELLEDAYWEEHVNNKLTKSELANRMGVHKSYVTRLFKGTSNMTLETMSSLAYELGRTIKVEMPERNNHVWYINDIGSSYDSIEEYDTVSSSSVSTSKVVPMYSKKFEDERCRA